MISTKPLVCLVPTSDYAHALADLSDVAFVVEGIFLSSAGVGGGRGISRVVVNRTVPPLHAAISGEPGC
jgi:hypothetical protein